MSETYTLTVLIKASTEDAVRKFEATSASIEKTAGKLSLLEKAGATAAGMLMRDMVQGLTSSFSEALRLGASLDTLQASFDRLRGGVSEELLSLESLRQATQGTVSDVELLTAANQAMALGLPREDLNRFFAAAMSVGHAVGRTTLQSIQDLTTGMGRLSPRILDNLGIIVNTEQAYQDFARSLGVEVTALTEAERKTAFQTAAMGALMEKADLLTGTTSSAQLAQEQFNASMDNAKTAVGGALVPLGAFGPILEGAIPVIGSVANVVLPGLITKYGLAGLATKALALITNISLQSVKTAFMTNPVTLGIMAIITALSLLYMAWENNWLGIRDIITSVTDAIMGAIGWLIDGLKSIGQFFADLFGVGGKADQAQDKLQDFGAAYEEPEEYVPPIIPAQQGFSGIVRRPTWFMAGERGPEHVQVTPGAATPAVAGGPVTLNLNVDLRGAYTTTPVDPQAIYRAVSDVTRRELRKLGVRYEVA